MTIRDAVSAVDELKPNAYSNDTKVRWLSQLEGRVQLEIMLMDTAEVQVYRWERDADAELLVDPPYDMIYTTYLAAMIDLANGEYEKYQNSMAVFNEAWLAFRRWFVARYRPADWPGIDFQEGDYV